MPGHRVTGAHHAGRSVATPVGVLILALVGAAASAQPPAADRAMIDRVAARLAAVVPAPRGYEWPPRIALDEDARPAAFADPIARHGARWRIRIVVTRGLLDRAVEGSPDRLAFVLGHEMAHLTLGHAVSSPPGRTAVTRVLFSRGQEEAADRQAMRWVVGAGYSYRSALRLLHRMLDPSVSGATGSVNLAGSGHPSWPERLARLDREQRPLWRAMSAFQTGVFMRSVEEYEPAERCFREVIREFPRCPEAWADLGDTLLEEYCESLSPRELEGIGAGPLLVGGFYDRPWTLEATARGPRDALWKRAVEAFDAALRHDPSSVLARAGLGVAYLMGPAPRDVHAARMALNAACRRMARDRSLSRETRAAILVNAAAAAHLDGRDDAAERCRREAERILRAKTGALGRTAPGMNRRDEIAAAICGQRALQRGGPARLVEYLKREDPSSTWWKAGYARYLERCGAARMAPAPMSSLRRGRRRAFRQVSAVKLGRVTVYLGEPVDEVARQLGAARAVPVIPGYDLRRLWYPAYDVELLVTDRVHAIRLTGPRSPAIVLRRPGLGAPSSWLRVAMASAGLNRALNGEPGHASEWIDPGTLYRYYRRLGLAVRESRGRVDELVVTQIPLAASERVSLR